MDPGELQVLLALIGPGCGWNLTRHRAVSVIGAADDGGDWWPSKKLGRAIGISAGRAGELLRELAARRIIHREGDRVMWCEVNARWERWDVAWSIDRLDVEDRVARYRAQVMQGVGGRFYRGSKFTRCPGQIARLISRDVVPPSRAHRGSKEPALMMLSGGADRGSTDPRSRAGLHSVPGPALIDAEAVGGSSPPPGDQNSSSYRPEEEEVANVDPGALAQASWALVARCREGTRAVWGTPEKTLKSLIAGHGVSEVIEAMERVPAGTFGPIKFVEQLAVVIAAGADLPEPAPVPVTPSMYKEFVPEPWVPPSPEEVAEQKQRIAADLSEARRAAAGLAD